MQSIGMHKCLVDVLESLLRSKACLLDTFRAVGGSWANDRRQGRRWLRLAYEKSAWDHTAVG